jgi:hypothetical protein
MKFTLVYINSHFYEIQFSLYISPIPHKPTQHPTQTHPTSHLCVGIFVTFILFTNVVKLKPVFGGVVCLFGERL